MVLNGDSVHEEQLLSPQLAERMTTDRVGSRADDMDFGLGFWGYGAGRAPESGQLLCGIALPDQVAIRGEHLSPHPL